MKSAIIAALWLAAAPAIAQAPALERLAEDVSAVLDPAGDARLLVIEDENGVTSPRTVRRGEEYADGWMLDGLTPTTATLKLGDQVETVDFTARLAPEPPPVVDVVLSGEVGITNASARWDPLNPDPIIRARIDRAISLGDMATLVRLGAESEDFATAAGVLAFGPGAAPWGTTALVTYEGRTAVLGSMAGGRIVIVVNDVTAAIPLEAPPPAFGATFAPGQGPLIIRGTVPADLSLGI